MISNIYNSNMPGDLMDSRVLLKAIFNQALTVVDPYRLLTEHAEQIRTAYREGGYKRLIISGFGKASSLMAIALEKSLGDMIEAGVVITKYGHAATRPAKIEIFESGHPIPDENGWLATTKIIAQLEGADEQTLAACLISGGGSALLVSPCNGISLNDKQRVTDYLLKAGADINELNAVRKHLSKVKGGRLAGIAWPAGVLSLIVSDVIGDRLDVIASGTTAPDPTTFADGLSVFDKYRLKKEVPGAVLKMFEQGAKGEIPETPKAGDKIFDKVANIVIGNSSKALQAAKNKAETLGLTSMIIANDITGEAGVAGRWLAERARTIQASHPTGPVCLISGGETTVTVSGQGKGGRNMELALAFALEIEGQNGITLLSAGTDGTDGPTEAAGAIVDGQTIKSARKKGLHPEKFLRDNDSYTFFEQSGDLLITGPTGTNVMDIQIMAIDNSQIV